MLRDLRIGFSYTRVEATYKHRVFYYYNFDTIIHMEWSYLIERVTATNYLNSLLFLSQNAGILFIKMLGKSKFLLN